MKVYETTSVYSDARRWEVIVPRSAIVSLTGHTWGEFQVLMAGEPSDQLLALHKLAKAIEDEQPAEAAA